MKIKKLVIKNYKKYRDISIELNSGINIFVGDNNSGKSTILEAISMVGLIMKLEKSLKVQSLIKAI